MFPVINLRKTGINLRRIMDKRGITVKDVQRYLGLSSVQSIYHWLNGLTMPTIDNLYALSALFQLPIDALVCGSRKAIMPELVVYTENQNNRRLYMYYKKLNSVIAA